MALFWRKQAQTAQSRAESAPAERPAELIEQFPLPAATLDERGRFAAVNARMQQLLGRERCVDRSALEATRSGELAEAVQKALAGETIQREFDLPASQKVVRGTLAPLAHGALVVLEDLTDARRLESVRRDFIANASHELRTPVAAISGAAETLLHGALPLDDHVRNFVEMIARHADRLGRLTRDLLDLSRLESGEFRPEIGLLDTGPLCESCLELFRPAAREKELVLGFDGPPGLKARADRRAVEQILVNLLDNAVKYTPRGGRVTVLADTAAQGVVISVIDTGPGIEPRHQARIFERFYRVDGGRSRDSGGTGLGLAIVKHLALAQGGEVGVESGAGGSRFWLRLPGI